MKFFNYNFFNKEIFNLLYAAFFLLTFFTDFRFYGPIGISEILFIVISISSIIVIFNNNFNIYINKNLMDVVLLLILTFILIFISTFISQLNTNIKHYNLLHNLAAFFYLNLIFLSIIILQPSIEKIIFFFFIGSSFILSFFLVASFFSEKLININLYYSNTDLLSLFTKNHHQLSFFTVLLLVLSFYYYNIYKKLLFIIIGILCAYTLYSSQSLGNLATLFLSIFITLLIYLYPPKFYQFINKKLIFIIFLFPIIILIILSNSINFNYLFFQYFYEPVNVNLRLQFVKNFIEHLNIISFFIGSGAGSFVYAEITSPTSIREIHNSFLDLFLYSGILPFLLIIFLFIKSLAITVKYKLFFLTILVIFIFFYSFTHNTIRYPFFWLIFIFISTLNYTKKYEN